MNSGLYGADWRAGLKRDAGFVGMAFLLMLALLQCAFLLILTLLAVLGVADLRATDGWYGMGSTGFLLAYLVAYSLVMGLPGPLTAKITHRRIRPFSAYKGAERVPLRASSLILGLLGGLGICVLANFLVSYLMAFFGSFGLRQPELPSYLEPTVASLLLNLLVFAVLPAVWEEMLFRGYFLRVLRPYGARFAVVVTAALFGLMHGNILQIPFAFIVGLACGWLTVKTGRVWPAMLLHFLNNGMAQVLDYLSLGLEQIDSQRLLLVTFCTVGIVGMASLFILFAKNDPLVSGLSKAHGGSESGGACPAAPPGRVGALFSSPAFSIAVGAGVLLTLLSVASTQLGGGV